MNSSKRGFAGEDEHVKKLLRSFWDNIDENFNNCSLVIGSSIGSISSKWEINSFVVDMFRDPPKEILKTETKFSGSRSIDVRVPTSWWSSWVYWILSPIAKVKF